MKRYRYYLFIFLIAGLFVVPQLWTQKMILGADALFHYNRFYETAEQIKTENFSYFISLFGFQKSGRIVNAVYGPLFFLLARDACLTCWQLVSLSGTFEFFSLFAGGVFAI
ncbi:hypothetical protein ABW365_24770 [Enterococcus avium]